MSWIVPQFTYNGVNTWVPTFPPVNKQPIATIGQEAVRHDSITISGLQQVVTERVDRVFDLDFPLIPQADLAQWDAFISWAIAGNQFTYAPDSNSPGTNVTCILMSTSIPYKRVAYQLFSITLKCRVVITAQVGS
jgi:hypothetical protein